MAKVTLRDQARFQRELESNHKERANKLLNAVMDTFEDGNEELPESYIALAAETSGWLSVTQATAILEQTITLGLFERRSGGALVRGPRYAAVLEAKQARGQLEARS